MQSRLAVGRGWAAEVVWVAVRGEQPSRGMVSGVYELVVEAVGGDEVGRCVMRPLLRR